MPLKLISPGGGSVIINPTSTGSTYTLNVPAVNANVTTDTANSVTQSMISDNVCGKGPAFSAYMGSDMTLSSATYTKLNLNLTEFNVGNCYNTSTYRFTPNVAGYYHFNGALTGSNPSTEKFILFYKNGSAYKYGYDGYTWVTVASCMAYMNGTTDYMELYGYMVTAVSAASGITPTYFQGHMVRSA